MKTFRDEAVVLRTYKLGEADRIITLLTRNNGQVRAVARGVRKTSSKFGAHLEPFSVVDIMLYRGHSLDTVTQVETIASHGRLIAEDLTLYATGSAIVETAEKLTSDSRENSSSHYLLLIGALHSLAHRRHEASLVLDSYLLRALAISGWAPSCFDCAICGAQGPHRAFSIPEGGAVCDTCRPAGSAAPSSEAMALMGDLLSGDWLRADSSDPHAHREVEGIVSAYTQWHLERRLRSLQVLEMAR